MKELSYCAAVVPTDVGADVFLQERDAVLKGLHVRILFLEVGRL